MPNDMGQVKILLAEDAKTMRKIEIQALKRNGYDNVVEAEDGKAAAAILQKDESIGLIISDWNMPNMDGLELLKWVRSNEPYKDVPFIMATGQSDQKQKKIAAEAGATGFVAKPFEDEELNRVIRKALGENDPEEETVQETAPQKTESGKVRLRIAHIQITDHLILGVLRNMIETGQFTPKHFELETLCMPGWNPVLDALEKGKVDAACVLAPIAMDLFGAGVPIKLILLAHKNGSVFVRSTQNAYNEPYTDFFKNKSFLIPHKMSVHHMLSHMFLSGIGLSPHMDKGSQYNVEFEVVPPIKMPEFLKANPANSGFMVAEPIGTRAISAGIAKLQFLSTELWPDHPCCVVAARDEVIAQHADALHELTWMLVKSGKFIKEKPEMAAKIAVTFLDPDKKLGLQVPILKNVLTEPQGIRTDDLFPIMEDIDRIQQYMVHQMGVGSLIDLEKFVDLQFAAAACGQQASSKTGTAFHDTPEAINDILNRHVTDEASTHKEKLDIEGKYLTFNLKGQEYGINILKIKEIIGLIPVRSMPQMPDHVKGVINLRGEVIPIMDLRVRLGMDAAPHTDRTSIIILELNNTNVHNHMGIIVDSVSEVLPINSSEIEDAPSFGIESDTDFILGMAKKKGGLKTLIDIEQVMA